jgi:hypothetical protein
VSRSTGLNTQLEPLRAEDVVRSERPNLAAKQD